MRQRLTADAILLFVTLIWGATFVLVQSAIREMPVLPFLTERFGIGGLLMAGAAVVAGEGLTLVRRDVLLAGSLIGATLWAGYVFQTWGLLYTSVARSGFITGLCVVLVPLAALLVLRQRVAGAAWAGAVLALVGLGLLSVGGGGAPNVGDALTFACAVCFALQIVLVSRYAVRLPTLPLATVQILTVALLSLLFSLPARGGWHTAIAVNLQGSVLIAVLVCAVLATALAYFVQIRFQARTTATHAAVIFAMEPVFAALSAVLLQHLQPSALQIAGMALMLIGMLVAELPNLRAARR
jgi:drug/metabolite transporter (DMT)-like permease